MERLNSEGVPRGQLLLALRDRKVVAMARRIDSCLLCRRYGVNEAGLCDICYGMLEGEEANIAQRWLGGMGP